MAFTDVVTPVLNRLPINCQEIGVRRTYRLAGDTTLSDGDLPAAIIRPGPLTRAIPVEGSGRTVISRNYIIELLVKVMTNSVEIDSQGVEALTQTIPWIYNFQNYFLDGSQGHTRLATNTTDGTTGPALRALQWMYEDVTLTDSGPTKIQGPGGGLYAGLIITLGIDMYQILTQTV